MAKQSKKPADLNRLAAAIVGEATTGEDQPEAAFGQEGAKARAAALTPSRRSEIARKAALARWAKKPPAQGD
jgi:hypothetical protein